MKPLFDSDLFFNHLFIIKKLQRDAFRKYSGYLSGRILDIGCGTAPYRGYLSCQSYVGIDESPEVRPDVNASCESIPFKNNDFDGVICTEVLEHLAEPGRCVAETVRVLKSGGYLYITIPQSWGLHYEPRDYWRFTRYGIEYLLKKYSFKIVNIERLGGVFSLAGIRMIDVLWSGLVNLFSFLGKRQSERIASLLCCPGSFLFYILGKIGDRIDKSDAIGWAVLARKQ
jgi:SAM-dependent methyltransferase